MYSIEWESFFSVGIVQFDKHHHDVVDLLNDVYEEFVNNAPVSDLKNVLILLRRKIESHIRSEEKLMKNLKYPLREIHVFAHGQFFKLFDKIYLNLEKEKYKFSLRLHATISYYILSHILNEDSVLSEYIANYGDSNASMLIG